MYTEAMNITISTHPKPGESVIIDGEFTATYEGVSAKRNLTLSVVPTEHGGTSGKGWLSIPLDRIDSHEFAIERTASGFVHTWTPRG